MDARYLLHVVRRWRERALALEQGGETVGRREADGWKGAAAELEQIANDARMNDAAAGELPAHVVPPYYHPSLVELGAEGEVDPDSPIP